MSELYKLRDFSFRYPFGNSVVNLPGDFTIKEGDILLLGGESGSGKSTLLYALKGFIPDIIFGKMNGEVTYNGKKLKDWDKLQLTKIGFLFQNPASQMIQRTVRQELSFGMENLSIDPKTIRQKVKENAEKFEIENLLDRDVHTLSGGEKQKVALLSILLMDPDVLLFDEPTAFLDPSSAKHFVDLFHQIAHNKTIITVEHNLDYLKPHVNRSLFITRDGVISEQTLENINWQPRYKKIPTMQIGEEILSIKNLNFAYDKPLLRNINLQINAGEIIAIKGDNGAGKSTLLKLISGLIKNYSGKITYKNKDIKKYHYKEYYKQISLLMQNPENHFIYDQVGKEIEPESGILELSNLAGFELRNPFTLSEGEKRRLSLAILWSLPTKLMLFDEPTFGQDPTNKEKLINLISDMRKSGKSFLIVSHDLPFIEAVADKIYLLKEGTLQDQSNA